MWLLRKIILYVLMSSVVAIHTFLDDLDEPLFSLFHKKKQQVLQDTVLNPKQPGDYCIGGTDLPLRGVCLPKHECVISGGKMTGHCGLFGTCCTKQRTCGNTTSSKVSYFISPENSRGRESSICDFNVKIANKDVCQIRLDFEKFVLAPPTSSEDGKSATCNDDRFSVKYMDAKFPILCGHNDQQHMYVQVDSNSSKSLMLSIQTNPRDPDSDLPTPEWRIRVTQLECPGSLYERKGSTSFQDQFKTSSTVSTAVQDFPLLAPAGCVQYFTKDSDSFESFNYYNGRGLYIGNLDYTICFKHDATACGMRFTPEKFQLGSNDMESEAYDADCTNVYLTVVDAVDSGNPPERHNKFCSVLMPTNTLSYNIPGPFYAVFHSGAEGKQDPGFRINYKILYSC